jgi:hypothetical protein
MVRGWCSLAALSQPNPPQVTILRGSLIGGPSRQMVLVVVAAVIVMVAVIVMLVTASALALLALDALGDG